MTKLKVIFFGIACIAIGFLLGNTKSFSSIVKAASDLWLSSGTNIYNTNSENIGIGKTTPASKLHIYQNDSSVSGTTGLTIEQDGSGDALTQYLLSGAQRWVTGVDNSDGNKFKIGRGSNWSLGLDLTIDTLGKIGIGTATPGSALHLYQNDTITGGSAGLTIEQDGSGDALTQYLLSGAQRWVTGVDNSDSDKFKIGRGSNWAYGPYVIMTTSGNVIVKLGN